jgi:hypothetical protein
MSDIAKPLRRQINWEIIIPRRGTYEVHFIGKRRDFYQPTEDQSRLWYDVTGAFEVLPYEIMQLYNKRREEVARQIIRTQKRQPSFEERVIDYYRQGLPMGAIASYCTTNKKVVMDILKSKGLID